jgi:hypothetical protein
MSEQEVQAVNLQLTLFFFCKLSRSSATIPDMIKTDTDILILKAYARVTPSKAECDKVSPK